MGRRRGECLFCHDTLQIAARGLCSRCYALPMIRRSFPLLMPRREPWSRRELASAVSLRDRGLTSREIGRRIGRTYFSVKEAFRRLARKKVTA